MTVSELAKASGLQKSTIHTHLRPLVATGFVDRHDDERLWVYYSLTALGRRLAQADRPRLLLLAAIAVAGLAFGLVLLWLGLAFADRGPGEPPPTGDLRGAPADPWAWVPLAAGLVLLSGAALAGLAGWATRRRLRAAPPSSPA